MHLHCNEQDVRCENGEPVFEDRVVPFPLTRKGLHGFGNWSLIREGSILAYLDSISLVPDGSNLSDACPFCTTGPREVIDLKAVARRFNHPTVWAVADRFVVLQPMGGRTSAPLGEVLYQLVRENPEAWEEREEEPE